MIKSGVQRLKMINKQLHAFSTITEGPVLMTQEHDQFLRVTLNNPKTLNALDLQMIKIIEKEIKTWNEAGKSMTVWMEGAGGKAFCAGGDIKTLFEAKRSGDPSRQHILEDFFRQEFELDYALTKMKPIQISVLDGIVMGGGVGISVHSPIRIATEKSVFAMPEAKIGFFTDVGGGYFLSRLRKNIGLYLGMTGARLKAEQLVQTGVANYFVPGDRLQNLQQALKDKLTGNFTLQDVQGVVNQFAEKIDTTYQNEDEINALFESQDFGELYSRFQGSNSEFAQKTFKLLNSQNPLSVRIIYEQIQRAKRQNLSLRDALIIDYRLSQRFMEGPDFFEGVRTVLVDRKDIPKFKYSNSMDVPQEEIDYFFSPMSNIKELEI